MIHTAYQNMNENIVIIHTDDDKKSRYTCNGQVVGRWGRPYFAELSNKNSVFALS